MVLVPLVAIAELPACRVPLFISFSFPFASPFFLAATHIPQILKKTLIGNNGFRKSYLPILAFFRDFAHIF